GRDRARSGPAQGDRNRRLGEGRCRQRPRRNHQEEAPVGVDRPMSKKLRSNFERGTSFWAVRRAQWRALGLSDADMEKPKIAMKSTSWELAICFSHLDGIATVVKDAIRAAGGLPFEIRTTAPSDFIHSPRHRGNQIPPSSD